MILGIRPPSGSYFDDPAANLDRAQNDDTLANALTKLEVIRFYEWINRGNARQRALRSDLVSLCVCPHLLPCKYPSAAWCAREHDVTREYASRLQRDFVRQFADYIQLRGQRFCSARRARPKNTAPPFGMNSPNSLSRNAREHTEP